MGIRQVGLPIHRANTQRFIDDDPTDIALIQSVEVWNAGSKTWQDGITRPVQTFKIIWAGSTGIVPIMEGVTTHRFDFIIVGAWDAVMEINDYWMVGEQSNGIDYIFPYNGYEVKGGGTSIGAKPNA